MGNQNLDWQGVPLEFEQEWRKTFAASQESLNLSLSCPICGQSTLHRAKLGYIRSIGSLEV
jgi:transposase-like protein